MDVRLIRQLWAVVETFPRNMLSGLDDSTLSQSLMDSIKADPTFDPQQLSALSSYIRARMPLIREMSQQR